MTNLTEQANDFLDEMRKSFESRIKSFHNRKGTTIEKYKSLEEWFIWSDERQNDYSYPDAISRDVDYKWDDITPKTRKEFGNKNNAIIICADILKYEYSIDIVKEVSENTQPCYRIHRLADELDWDIEAELGYKKLSKLVTDKHLDHGTALKLYWELQPAYYTMFNDESEIEDKFVKKAFKNLKKLETRLINNDFKSNIIPYIPEPTSIHSNEKWEIPKPLFLSNHH